jgi:hypothetical protein
MATANLAKVVKVRRGKAKDRGKAKVKLHRMEMVPNPARDKAVRVKVVKAVVAKAARVKVKETTRPHRTMEMALNPARDKAVRVRAAKVVVVRAAVKAKDRDKAARNWRKAANPVRVVKGRVAKGADGRAVVVRAAKGRVEPGKPRAPPTKAMDKTPTSSPSKTSRWINLSIPASPAARAAVVAAHAVAVAVKPATVAPVWRKMASNPAAPEMAAQTRRAALLPVAIMSAVAVVVL